MLRWTIIFLVFALVAALFGFTSIAGASIEIAKFLFFIFLAIWIISLIVDATRKRR